MERLALKNLEKKQTDLQCCDVRDQLVHPQSALLLDEGSRWTVGRFKRVRGIMGRSERRKLSNNIIL